MSLTEFCSICSFPTANKFAIKPQIFILSRAFQRGFRPVTNTINSTGKQLAARLLRVQAGAIFLLACVFSLVQPINGYLYFWGVVGGGIAVMIPTALFAWRAFASGGARAAQQVVSNFFAGEAIKLTLAVALLVALLVFTTLPYSAVLSGYIITLFVQWLAPILFLKST
ncbi:F0F1 ATP synthase subunit I [Pseudidiomarina aestuarii]|uniref:F0F1 ATP synthase subunit I n=1 Tax=Pseudidiomarina aestuarii TaxID=624146 RepID=A0A7Z6ZWA1_9GAMM|nr:F0F1 ATP synthase subunit I [Pseudidiomarina aestuarii]